ncbi:unnamed protein product [Sphagnum balticum]
MLTGELLLTLPPTTSRITCMTRVPVVDQLVLLTGDLNGTVTLWHLNAGRSVGVAGRGTHTAGKCVHLHLNSHVTHVTATDTRFACVYGLDKKMIIVRIEDILKLE